jgi:hypothetical protein
MRNPEDIINDARSILDCYASQTIQFGELPKKTDLVHKSVEQERLRGQTNHRHQRPTKVVVAL